jgi:tetratricopeptide (TPR) repeat protein
MQSPLPDQAASVPPQPRLVFFAIAVALAWGLSLQGDFVWIDHAEVESGYARIRSVEEFSAIWGQSLDQFLERSEGRVANTGGYFRPIYCVSLTIDWLLSRGTPAWFHFENLLWQLLVVWLLYKLGCRLFEAERHGEVMAFWAAMLFAVHPMCGQSVAWICGRKDLLCAAFGLSSLLWFVASMREPIPDEINPVRPVWRLVPVVAAPVALLLAVLSKEPGFVVPVVATIWWWFQPGELDIVDPEAPTQSRFLKTSTAPHTVLTRRTRLRGSVTLGLLWCVAAGAIFYRVSVIGAFGLGEQYPAPDLYRNIEISCSLLCSYVLRIFAPFQPTIVDRWFIGPRGIVGVLGVVAVSVSLLGLIRSIWRRSLGAFGWAWFLIWMLPASGILPLRHLYAERYLFPGMWGLMAATTHAFFRYLPIDKSNPAHRRKRFAALVVTVVLGAISFNQTQYWRSDRDLFAHALNQDENYAEGAVGLASYEMGQREYKKAADYAQQAIEATKDPDYHSYWSPFVTYSNLGLANFYAGNHEEATAAFEESIQARPQNAVGHYHLGLVAMTSNRLDVAVQHFKTAIKCQPNHYLSLSNLGFAYLQQQRFAESIKVYEPLIVAAPGDTKNRSNLATAYLMDKRDLDAEFQFKVLLRDVGPEPVLYAKLAWAQWRLGRATKALLNIKEAVQKDPKHPTVTYVANMIRQAEMRFKTPPDQSSTKEPASKPPLKEPSDTSADK